MTADVDLLPLPEADGFMESFDTYGCPVGTEDAWAEGTVKDYARDNVARNTALLRAEVEVLRTEVERVTCELMDALTHADNLEEALREAYKQVRELCDCCGHAYPEASFVRYEALLRAQEEEGE